MRENNGVYCSPTTWCGIHLSVATPNRQNDNDQFRTILLVTQPYTVIARVFAAPFSPNFMSKSRGASYMCISSFKPFYPHKISRQNQQDTA